MCVYVCVCCFLLFHSFVFLYELQLRAISVEILRNQVCWENRNSSSQSEHAHSHAHVHTYKNIFDVCRRAKKGIKPMNGLWASQSVSQPARQPVSDMNGAKTESQKEEILLEKVHTSGGCEKGMKKNATQYTRTQDIFKIQDLLRLFHCCFFCKECTLFLYFIMRQKRIKKGKKWWKM